VHGERKPRRLLVLQVAALGLALSGCARGPVTSATTTSDAGASRAAEPAAARSSDASSNDARDASAAPAPSTIDPDGDDDPEDPGEGTAPSSGRFAKVGTPPMALTRICDLTPFKGALYMAHANQPLGTDGATITRFDPKDAKRPFRVAFDWNRPGEPTKGGGAGQGFLRAHAIGGRLFVADADPPYNGLGLVEGGTEGYVFVSDESGAFAPPRAPSFRPPAAPDLAKPESKGAGVLPRAYHVIDVIKYRGALYASTGSVPPKERAWHGPSPGALHRASADGSRWLYEIDYPFPYMNGVWRLTYMVRFHDRLYAGIQDYDGREHNDYVYFAPDSSAAEGVVLERKDIHPVRVTPSGAAGTLRWWVDTRAAPHRLYWIAWARDGVNLRVTTDGDTWRTIPMPEGAGRPTDVTRFRDAVVVLTERGLWRLDGDAVAPEPIAKIEDKKSPFEVSDFFCVAPLAVLEGELYAGGQRGGTLYKLATDAVAP
jgi:hypothetical protein